MGALSSPELPASMAQVFFSSEVPLNVKVSVLNLHGSIPEMSDSAAPLSYTECLGQRVGAAAADLYVTCQLHAHGQPIGLSERTYNMPGSRLRWNEWLTFMPKYCDLSADAVMEVTLIGSKGSRGKPVGSVTFPLFDESQHLRTGVINLLVELTPDEEKPTVTEDSRGVGPLNAMHPSLSVDSGALQDPAAEMARLEGLSARHERVAAMPDPTLDWLNRPTYVHLEQRQQVRELCMSGLLLARAHAIIMQTQ